MGGGTTWLKFDGPIELWNGHGGIHSPILLGIHVRARAGLTLEESNLCRSNLTWSARPLSSIQWHPFPPVGFTWPVVETTSA